MTAPPAPRPAASEPAPPPSLRPAVPSRAADTGTTGASRTTTVDDDVAAPSAVSHRSAFALIVGASIALLTAVCGVVLIADLSLPPWALFVGRWIPALVAFVLLVRTPGLHGSGPGTVADWWGLRRSDGPRPTGPRLTGPRLTVPRPRGRIVGTLLTSAGAAAGVVVIAVVTALLAATVGAIHLEETRVLLLGALAIPPLTLLLAVSTLGEEVVWRGHLPRLLGGGFWQGACAIAGAWTAFHVPLHLTYALQGDMPTAHAAAVTLGLFPLGLFLSAVTARWGTVWPAVIAHAVPVSALTLAADAPGLDAAAVWTVTGISAALFLSAGMAIAPLEGARRPHSGSRR